MSAEFGLRERLYITLLLAHIGSDFFQLLQSELLGHASHDAIVTAPGGLVF